MCERWGERERERIGRGKESERAGERMVVYRARVVIADCVEWGPGALSNGTERELPSCPTRPAVRCSVMQASRYNENLYGFICRPGTTLFANRRGVGQRSAMVFDESRHAMRGVKSNNFSTKKNSSEYSIYARVLWKSIRTLSSRIIIANYKRFEHPVITLFVPTNDRFGC